MVWTLPTERVPGTKSFPAFPVRPPVFAGRFLAALFTLEVLDLRSGLVAFFMVSEMGRKRRACCNVRQPR
jgi:hypothetical protein